MPDGGRLRVTSEGDDPAEGATATRLRVRVADTGRGVPEELRDRIFKPFFSTKSHGTGFGLPLAARTVEEHGGRLELAPDAAPGSGAVFVVELPLAAAPPTS
jgi:signal transduction histidine kinase